VATVHHAGASRSGPTGLLRRFVGPALEEQTYRRLLYVLLGPPLGIAYAVFLMGALSFAAGLVVTLVGIPLLYGVVLAWRGLAEFERAVARGLLGTDLPSPAPPAGATAWARARSRVTDPLTWKALVYLFAKLPLGILTFAVTAALIGGGLALLTMPFTTSRLSASLGPWLVDTRAEAVALVPAGLVLALLGLHAVNGIAWVWARLAHLMLAPAPDAELRARVAEVTTSRARIIEATDAERRRIERDLHDGAQQRLVALSLTLGLARSKVDKDPPAAAGLIDDAQAEAARALTELRELARGLHPAILTDHGLGAALDALSARSPVPVEVAEVPAERLRPALESTAYFVVSEALANVAKYAEATQATVRVVRGPRAVLVEVKDDGVGGADPGAGTGLRGLADRVEALDGRFEVLSSPGRGTTVRAELPLG
jgi:signal transduction histidine kinase